MSGLRQRDLRGVEMTRRKFIRKLLSAGSAIVVGVCWLTRKVMPRGYVWAGRLKKYPGSVKTLPNTYDQSEWSG